MSCCINKFFSYFPIFNNNIKLSDEQYSKQLRLIANILIGLGALLFVLIIILSWGEIGALSIGLSLSISIIPVMIGILIHKQVKQNVFLRYRNDYQFV
tara:strand:- start:1010 stop:1303 length:294 start_codon:yes stop_codon:yes gene_type:complete